MHFIRFIVLLFLAEHIFLLISCFINTDTEHLLQRYSAKEKKKSPQAIVQVWIYSICTSYTIWSSKVFMLLTWFSSFGYCSCLTDLRYKSIACQKRQSSRTHPVCNSHRPMVAQSCLGPKTNSQNLTAQINSKQTSIIRILFKIMSFKFVVRFCLKYTLTFIYLCGENFVIFLQLSSYLILTNYKILFETLSNHTGENNNHVLLRLAYTVY